MNTTALTAAQAQAVISTIVKDAAGLNPGLNLRFGYIGNMELQRDDRSFRVFTNRVDATGRNVCFHLGGYDELPAGLERLISGIDAFIARVNAL